MHKLPALPALALLAGCTSQQVYDGTSELRAQQCAKLEVRGQAECTAQARQSYGENRQHMDEASGKLPRQ